MCRHSGICLRAGWTKEAGKTARLLCRHTKGGRQGRVVHSGKIIYGRSGVGIVPEGNWGLGPEEGVITLNRVVFKGPWILEPGMPELEAPKTKLGRSGSWFSGAKFGHFELTGRSESLIR